MPRARELVSTGLGAFLAAAAGLPLAASSPARAAQVTAQYCPVGKPRPHYLQRLAARFDDRGNEDPADDRLEATLTLCGRADPRAAYEISLDVRPPLFTDADRNGDGKVGRKDFCAETRDAVVRWHRRPHGDAGGDGVTSELVPGQGGMPDAIRFSGPVAALERAIGEALPRDNSRAVFVWAEARPRAAVASPYAYVPDRRAVDRLPVPDLSDGCARPQAAAEALAVTLTDPATQTFDYTGEQQTYTVPQGVSSLQLTVTGASGGSGYLPPPGLGGRGGPSAQVTGYVSVTPGQQLTIDVGGGGGNATGTGPSSAGSGGPTDVTWIRGGGGSGSGGDGTGGGGGGGGAGSIVSVGATILVNAGGGGGGGGGGCFINYFGGGGGGAGPQTGINGGGNGFSGSGTGGGAGGTAAASSFGPGVDAQGASGGTFGGGGGGGGAGNLGGDAGAAGGGGCGGGGGGGAGSNYTDPSVTGVVVTQTTLPAATDGSVVITPQ